MLGRGGVARQQCLFVVLMCSWDSCECSWPASGSLGPLARGPHGAKSSRIRGMERGRLARRGQSEDGQSAPHALSSPVTPGHVGGGCSWASGDPGDKPLAWHRLPRGTWWGLHLGGSSQLVLLPGLVALVSGPLGLPPAALSLENFAVN